MATQVLKRKKKWFSILAGPEFNNSIIGETLANEDANVVGRTIEVNLANLTGDAKSQNIKVEFRIKEVKDNELHTEIMSYEMISTYVKRIMRPGKEKVEDSWHYITKDNIKIKIKLLILTKAKTKHSILSSIHYKSREFLQEYCKKSDYKILLNDLISHNLQKELKNLLKKIYPLSVCEVRMMERI